MEPSTHVEELEADPDLKGLFVRHGLRLTRQRRAVYHALYSSHDHPSGEMLYRLILKDQDDISLATVYNALEAFCRCGLAKKLASQGPACRYDSSTHNHLHLRDTRTGRVLDVPEDLSEAVLKHLPQSVVSALQSRMGFNVKQINIEFVGECTR